MLDIVLLSYKEPNAEEAWDKLQERFPWAMRVDGVKGIQNAHRRAAEAATTSMFYVVDADAEVKDTFDFTYTPPRSESVHVWRCENSVNGLVYGYGGIKLFPRKLVLGFDSDIIDFTTTVADTFIIMDEVASVTKFNTSPFDSWKSGFRECVKLSSKVIDNQKSDETRDRLDVWCSIGYDAKFGDECIQGANDGREYGMKYRGNPDMLALINDFDWLRKRYDEQ